MMEKISGIMSDIVDRRVAQPINLSSDFSINGNTRIHIPNNPIRADNKVDFIFTFKMPHNNYTNINKNAVFVTTMINEVGSSKHLEYIKSFGGANFINRIRKGVLDILMEKTNKQLFPGDLTIGWWSGGGAAGREIIKERNLIDGGIQKVVSLDGMHNIDDSTMRFAEDAANNPSIKFYVVSTGVTPPYTSTSQISQQIANRVGLNYNTQGNWEGFNRNPDSVAQSNGLNLIRLYNPGQYSDTEQRQQHINALNWGYSLF